MPAEQATAMYEALKEAGALVVLEVFQGEGHGFRLAANIRRRYEAELSFYRQVWKIGGACSEPDSQRLRCSPTRRRPRFDTRRRKHPV